MSRLFQTKINYQYRKQPTMTKLIISLTGLPGVGKDTVADHLCKHRGFERIAFADAVKREISEAFFDAPISLFNDRKTKATPIPRLRLADCKHKPFVDWYLSTRDGEYEFAVLSAGFYSQPRSPRWMMQQWGTGYRRAQDDQYWVKRLVENMPKNGRVIIADVRFDNEVLSFTNHKHDVWEIVRPNNPHHNKNDKHVSNAGLSDGLVNRVILNSGTTNQLVRKAVRQVDKLLVDNA